MNDDIFGDEGYDGDNPITAFFYKASQDACSWAFYTSARLTNRMITLLPGYIGVAAATLASASVDRLFGKKRNRAA